MKNIISITILSLILMSCDISTQKQNDKANEPTVIGSSNMGDGKINPIIVGDTSNEQIWIDYIKAHNERNLDKIDEINADDWIGYTADGSVENGSTAHLVLLDT